MMIFGIPIKHSSHFIVINFDIHFALTYMKFHALCNWFTGFRLHKNLHRNLEKSASVSDDATPSGGGAICCSVYVSHFACVSSFDQVVLGHL